MTTTETTSTPLPPFQAGDSVDVYSPDGDFVAEGVIVKRTGRHTWTVSVDYGHTDGPVIVQDIPTSQLQ